MQMPIPGVGGIVGTKAPEFPKDFTWLNTKQPLSLAKLKGQIVIVDFWTYCCINCMHQLPTLARIEEQYQGKQVIVIGVHSAKFENEQKPENVTEAITRYEIKHPVIVDQKHKIWNAYGASAWPTTVIIDPTGKIVYKKAGERPYLEIDSMVEQLFDKHTFDGSLAKAQFKIERPAQKGEKVLSYPGKMSFSPDKGARFALSDSNHNRILIIETKTGKILAEIGSGKRGFADGAFDKATFFRPQGVLWFAKDTVFVADTENHAIRRIDLAKKTVETVAGTGDEGPFVGYEPIYAEGKKTPLSSPWDLALYKDQLLIAMAGMHQIWGYEVRSGRVYPYAGDGLENITDGTYGKAEFAQPSGVCVDGDTLFVADSEVSGIRSVDLKQKYVSTIVGTGLFVFGHKDGSLADAKFQHPIGISEAKGTIYVADTYNSAVRAIDLKKGRVTTLIGKPGEKSFCRFDDPDCDTLGLYEPNDVKVNGNVLYIVDTNNHLVRTFDLKEMRLKTLKIR